MASDGLDLYRDLQSGLRRKQLQAMRSLQNPGVTIEADPAVMTAISSCMTAAQSDVRAMATKTVGILAEPGDHKYIDLVSDRLTDDRWFVRRAAVESFGRIALKSDPKAIAAVGDMIRDDHVEVRNAALEVFASFAEKVDRRHALKALNVCLEDGNPEVRRIALLALGLLARPGRMPLTRHNNIMLMNKRAMQQWTPRRKVEKTETHTETMMLTDILRAMTAKLNDVHFEVRRTAVEMLGQCSPMGHIETMANLQTCLTDRTWHVRKAAVEALSCLEDDDETEVKASVRKVANETPSRQSTATSYAGRNDDAGWFFSCLFRRSETDSVPCSREATDCSFESE